MFTFGLSLASVDAPCVVAAAAGGIFSTSAGCESTGGWSGLNAGELGSSAFAASRGAGGGKGGFAVGVLIPGTLCSIEAAFRLGRVPSVAPGP
jgi:hypothetical protein